MSKSRNFLAATALCLLTAAPAFAQGLGLGRPATLDEIAAWDITVLPDGKGLKPGSGDVARGEEVFLEACAACHGEFAEGLDSWPSLSGGQGSLTDPRPVKTIGSYWPYLSTVWDYVHRSMPFGAAQTISVDDTYAITAFLLYSNGLVEEDFTLSHENFTEVKLPNEGGFYVDDRPTSEYPLFSAEPCMENCRTEPPKVTKRAVDLNVTPRDPDGRPAGSMPELQIAAATSEAPAAAAAAETKAEAPAETPAEAPAETPADQTALDPALIEAGAKVFRKCSACHKVGEGAANGTGPQLNGIIGKTAGTAEGYKYSKPMLEAGAGGLIWTAEALDAFLADPKAAVAKNKMAFAGLKKAQEREAVIAYLQSFAQ